MRKILSLFVILVVLFSINTNLSVNAEIFYANDSYTTPVEETVKSDKETAKHKKKIEKEEIFSILRRK